MKTIFSILIILLVAALVSAGFYWLAENTNATSDNFPEGERARPEGLQLPEGTERPERGEGGEHGASITRGIGEVAGILIKLSIVTVVVLLVQKGLGLAGTRHPISA